MAQGWVKIYREIIHWQWYGDINVTRVFIHLLLTVNHKDTQWQGIMIEPGQRVTSMATLEKELGMTARKIRTALSKLEKSGIVSIKTTSRYTLLSIVNWGKYQSEVDYDGKRDVKPMSDQCQSDVKQMSTNNNDNNNNNGENEKNIATDVEKENSSPLDKKAYGPYSNVLLTDSQLAQLKDRFGPGFYEKLDRFSTGLEMKGYRYKNHYLAMLSWFEKEESRPAEAPGEDVILRNMTKVPVFRQGG